MNILIAMDSLKGSLTSAQANAAVQSGLERANQALKNNLTIHRIELADGGEGTSEAFRNALGGHNVTCKARDALGNQIQASYTISPDNTAIIEIAASSGLPSVPKELRNPEKTSSAGLGDMILDALSRNCRRFIIGLGGSSTNDAGLGALQALGFSFSQRNETSDQNHSLLMTDQILLSGAALENIVSIDKTRQDSRLQESEFLVACDVENPFSGENGATHVFAIQKGADHSMINRLESGMQNFARLLLADTGLDVNHVKGTGAAGGIAGSLVALLGAELKSGFELLSETIQLEKRLKNIDLVFTGEGKLDLQSLQGKGPVALAQLARRQGCKTIGFFGKIPEDNGLMQRFYEQCFDACFSFILGPMSLDDCMEIENAQNMLGYISESVLRTIELNK